MRRCGECAGDVEIKVTKAGYATCPVCGLVYMRNFHGKYVATDRAVSGRQKVSFGSGTTSARKREPMKFRSRQKPPAAPKRRAKKRGSPKESTPPKEDTSSEKKLAASHYLIHGGKKSGSHIE